MQIVIEIPESIYDTIQSDEMINREQLAILQMHIMNGVPLPKGHWRLIDEKEANALITKGKNGKAYFGTVNKDWEVIDFLKTVPTIIEADEAESEDKECGK